MAFFSIQDLVLSSAPSDFSTSAGEDATASVGSGQATAFVTGISDQNKKDVMNSTLLAQLAASGRYDRLKQTDKWYDFYKSVLEGLGWDVTNFRFDDHSIGNTAISVDAIVVDFLKTFMDVRSPSQPEQLELMTRVIAALENSKDPSVNIFTSSSANDHEANFQLGVCSEDRDKNIMFLNATLIWLDNIKAIGAFAYTTDETITNVLFTKIRSGSASFRNVDKQVYAEVRQTVLEKLGTNAQKPRPPPSQELEEVGCDSAYLHRAMDSVILDLKEEGRGRQ
ncbi:hypothetical protein BDZ97DRAFT_1764409 [Flammula alnicola]|nr:hypothetical protein BDZ97DRAFT_1764409 [Flammula alnicola]